MVFKKTQPENTSYVGTCEISLQNLALEIGNKWAIKKDLLA